MSSAIRLEHEPTALDTVAGWRRWIGHDADRDSGLLISRPATRGAASPAAGGNGLAQLVLLRHPALARVLEAGADDGGFRVVEEVDGARPLTDSRCRLPRGEALAQGLLAVLEALAYLHRQGLAHGSVSRSTVFSDGRSMLLTGGLLAAGTEVAPSTDVRDWARLTWALLDGAPAGGTAELLQEVARQALVALDERRSLDAARVIRAVHRAIAENSPPVEASDEAADDPITDDAERSWRMKAYSGALQFTGSFIIGALTTVLTISLIGAAVALGVIWFLGRLPQEVRVPIVVGLAREEAEDRLKQEGLGVGSVRSVYREDVEPGNVAETKPPSGMVVRQGRDVTLIVSMGAARVKVPRIVGLRLDEAEKVLEKQGLRLVDGGKMRSGAPEGEIVQQDPSSGYKIAQGQRVLAQVSGGPEFGVVEAPADEEGADPLRMVFRRVEIVVPRGDALQRVVVREGYGDTLDVSYDRLHRPGDRIKLDTYGRPGKQIRVVIEGDEVFKTQL